MNNILFFIPVVYTLRTRYKSILKKATYLITFVIPVMLIFFLQNTSQKLSMFFLLIIFLLGFISIINIYEVGYIWNDTETIKKENKPTKRLSVEQSKFYYKNRSLVYFTRILIFIFLIFIIKFFESQNSLLAFILFEILILFIFFIYNNIRNKISIFLYFILISLRYMASLFIYVNNVTLSSIISSVIVFPLVRALEYKAHYQDSSVKSSFFFNCIIRGDIRNIPQYRFWTTLLLFLLSFYLMKSGFLNIIPVISTLYIFIYRAVLLIAEKLGFKSKEYLSRS